MNIKITKSRLDAIIPTSGSERAAGYDLYVPKGVGVTGVNPKQTYKIDTGICMEIPDGYVGLVFARSGLATKKGLRLANSVGVIDSDYRGSIGVVLYNDSSEIRAISGGDRVAQLVITPCLTVDFKEVDKLGTTERGDGGFGSTGMTASDNGEEVSGQLSLYSEV